MTNKEIIKTVADSWNSIPEPTRKELTRFMDVTKYIHRAARIKELLNPLTDDQKRSFYFLLNAVLTSKEETHE